MCIAAAKPKDVSSATGVYGPSGTCWTAQDETTCEARCATLTAGVHTEQPSVAACGKPTVQECLQCITDSFLYDNCGTPGCKAVATCVEACSTTACVTGCLNAAAPADAQAFKDQFASVRLDTVCNGPSGRCYAHCAGIASFYCPAFGRAPEAP